MHDLFRRVKLRHETGLMRCLGTHMEKMPDVGMGSACRESTERDGMYYLEFINMG